MGITTKYFTNTSHFEEIAEKLRTADTLPDQIESNFLKMLGFTNPANELILNFFKDLNFLNEDNTPTLLLKKFRETEEPKKVFAHSILEAYGELFDKDPTIHQQSKEEIKERFQSCLTEDKSSIIIKYMVNTFKVVVDYAGHKTIAEVWEKKNSDIFSLIEQQETDTDIKNIQLEGEKNNGESVSPKALSISPPVNGTGNGMKEEAELDKPDEEVEAAEAKTEEKVEVAEQDEEAKLEVEETAEEDKNKKGEDGYGETSGDLTAKESISRIKDMTVEEAQQFVDDDEDRVTVINVLDKKIEGEKREESSEEIQNESEEEVGEEDIKEEEHKKMKLMKRMRK